MTRTRPERGVVATTPRSGLVLVIDDEPYLVDLSLTFLKRNGLAGKGFTDPEEAIEWFRENHSSVDLTILDMKMPVLNGSECFDYMRAIDPGAPGSIARM